MYAKNEQSKREYRKKIPTYLNVKKKTDGTEWFMNAQDTDSVLRRKSQQQKAENGFFSINKCETASLINRLWRWNIQQKKLNKCIYCCFGYISFRLNHIRIFFFIWNWSPSIRVSHVNFCLVICFFFFIFVSVWMGVVRHRWRLLPE